MKNSRLIFLLLVAGMLCVSTQALANVFASNIRITQQGGTGPFDCRFSDGTGIALRFVLSDRADSVVAVIKLGSTVVRNITATALLSGDNSIVWDGKDNDGLYVVTGAYTLSLTTYDKGYATYTEISYPDAAGLSQRGMTTVNNPALKSFGFIFDVDNGGIQGAVGACRFSADGKPWGDANGVAKISYTSSGITLGPGEARWGTQADDDGYIYVMGRTAKQIYRFHPDTMKVTMFDSAFGAYYPFGIAIRKDAVGKTFAVVTNTNSATATLTGDSRILTYHTNNDAPYFGAKDTLLKGNGTVMYWDAVFGRDSALYATFIYVGNFPRSGVAKFNLKGKTLPLTLADTAWTARVDSGCVSTISMYFGTPTDGSQDAIYFVNARIASGNPPAGQGIYVLTGLNNARPTKAYAYPDKQLNASITRSDVSVDAVGNIVYFENSNEEIALISPPTGPNSYTTTAAMQVFVIPSVPLSSVIVDANGDFKPDSLGKTVTVIGIVNSLNYQGTASTSYSMQEDSAGILLFGYNTPGLVLNIGYRVAVTGVIAQYRGTTEITPAAPGNVSILDSNNVLTPVQLTIPQFKANAEKYESRLIKINGLGKMPSTPAWPAAGADANFTMWDGWDTVLVRLDKDMRVSGYTEPTYPSNVQGVVTQYTSAGTVYNDGYQLSPVLITDFTSAGQLPPNPHFALATPAKGSTITVEAATQSVVFSWKSAVDLNGDKLTYQWIPIGSTAVPTGNSAADTFLVRTGSQLRTWMAGKDTTVKWTVKAKDPTNPLVSSLDTASINLVMGKFREPSFAVTPALINFGTVINGTTKKDSVTVKNTGTDSLLISAVTSSNTQFTVTPATARLDSSASQKFYITFAPTTGVLQSASIIFASNTTKAKDTVKVSGTVVSIATITTQKFTTTVTNTGHIGALTDFQVPAPSFSFGGSDRLFEGSFLIADSAVHVSNSVRMRDGGWNPGFKQLSDIVATKVTSTTRTSTSYDDSNMPRPLGVKVIQQTIADTNGAYMMIRLGVVNTTSAAISNVLVGSFFDFDMTPSTGADRGGFLKDTTNTIAGVNGGAAFKTHILYQQPPTGGAFIGVVPLSQTVFTAARIGINPSEIWPNPLTDTMKYKYLSQFRSTKTYADSGANIDLSMSSSVGPFTLGASSADTTNAAFAIVTGTSLNELIANARLVQKDYAAMGYGVRYATGVENEAASLPTQFALDQNYPNPFNPSTSIRFALPQQAQTSLVIYDMLGREVRTLVNNTMNAGNYQVVWDGRNSVGVQVATGVYIYRIQAGSFVNVKKMMLLK